MSIVTMYQSFRPSYELVEKKCSAVFSNIATAVNKVAIPTIILLALTCLPCANAGEETYASYISLCSNIISPLPIDVCAATCLPFIGRWCS